MKLTILVFTMFLVGCSLFDDSADKTVSMTQAESQASQPDHTTDLAKYNEKLVELVDELVSLPQYDFSGKNTVVSTFVWNENFTAKSANEALRFLGIQLSEQTKHQLVKHHANIIETYGAQSLAISADGMYFLSRDLDELYTQLNADYVVTGVMSQQKQGIMLNAYIVDFESKIIVGSAQQFFPNYMFEDENQVTLQKGKLFISREGH